MERKRKDRLEARNVFLESFGNLLPGGIGVYEISEHIRPLYLSQGVYRLCNGFDDAFYEQAEKSAEFLLTERDYVRLREEIHKAFENETMLDCTLRYHMTPKSNGWVWIRGKAIAQNKRHNLFIALILDVTQKKNLENELQLQNERYRILEETTDEILFEVDVVEDVMTYSYKEMDGGLIRQRVPHYSKSLETNPMVHPDYLEIFKENLMIAINRRIEGKLEYLSKISGHGYEWHRVCYHSIEDESGNVTRVIGRIKNIHDEVLERQTGKGYLMYDLQNQSGLQHRIQDSLDNADLEDKHALAMISINHFKKIIEQNGVAWGDTALKLVVEMIQETVDEQALLGRLDDGRILFYCKNIGENDLDNTMNKIISLVEHSDNKVANLNITCSIGAAMMEGAADYMTFYQAVEEALHIAKITKDEKYIRV